MPYWDTEQFLSRHAAFVWSFIYRHPQECFENLGYNEISWWDWERTKILKKVLLKFLKFIL